MNLLLATPWLPPLGGGLERYADAVARRLTRRGHRVVHLAHAPRAADEDDGRLRRVAVAPRLRVSNTPAGLAVLAAARRLLREEDVDVVNVHTPVPGTAELVAHAARRQGAPYVVTYHAGRLAGPPGLASAAAALHRVGPERRFLARARARIAVSPFVRDRVFRSLPSEVVAPGVDTGRFRPVADPVPGRILFVGPVDRAYRWKGLHVLVDAFEALAPGIPHAHLRIVGAGNLLEAYAARARAMGLADRIQLAGRVGDEALVEEYSRAQVVVLPSTSPAESFGMVLAEANACGRPVVGSRVGGIPAFVRDGDNGLLARPGDPRSLAGALGALLGDPDLAAAMGKRGRARVVADHDWDDVTARTEEILQSSTNGPEGG